MLVVGSVAFAAGLVTGLGLSFLVLPGRERRAYREGQRDAIRRFEREKHARWRSESPPPE